MSRSNSKCAAAIALALVSAPTGAQDGPPELGLCMGATTKPDARTEACARLIETEVRESARRQALALSFRALGWRTKGEREKALADLAAAIKLAPDFAPPYEARGDLLRDTGQFDEAIADYDQAIRLKPEGNSAYVSRAICHFAKDEPERAVADLNLAIKLDPDNSGGIALRTWEMKARLYAATNKPDQAIGSIDEAIKLQPRNATFYIDRAALWIAKGDDYRALADYQDAIKLDENNKDGVQLAALRLRALFNVRKGSFDAALADNNEAIRIEPQRGSLYVERAGVWSKKGDDEKALADYDKAVEIEPKNAALHVARGDFLRDKSNYERALKDYDQAIEQQADYMPAYGGRGLTRFYAGDFAKATDDFKRVVDEQNNAYSMLMLYLARARSGQRDATSELGKTAAKLERGEWPYPVVELYLGRKQVQAVEAAARTPEQRCEAQFYIGEWQLLQRANAQAAKALQTAVDTCPKDFVEYRGAVDELKRIKSSSDTETDPPKNPRNKAR